MTLYKGKHKNTTQQLHSLRISLVSVVCLFVCFFVGLNSQSRLINPAWCYVTSKTWQFLFEFNAFRDYLCTCHKNFVNRIALCCHLEFYWGYSYWWNRVNASEFFILSFFFLFEICTGLCHLILIIQVLLIKAVLNSLEEYVHRYISKKTLISQIGILNFLWN